MNDAFVSHHLTCVNLVFIPRRMNIYLRFGRPCAHRALDRQHRLAMFSPDCILGRVHWEANQYGTTLWQLTILQTAHPREPVQRLIGVQPGASILLQAHGAAQVQALLRLIDHIEAQAIDPADVSPAYWQSLQSRAAANIELPRYHPDRHAAYLARRTLH
jgi:uncharacterized protein DUF2840